MSLAYFYEPFHDPSFSIADFNRLFDPSACREIFRGEQSSTVTDLLRPRMDLHESKEANEMTAIFELPGMKKEDVSVDIHQNRLVVSGKTTITNELNDGGYTVRERKYGKFSRSIPLPTGTKADDIKASMENGLLTIKFPKSHPDHEPRKVLIS